MKLKSFEAEFTYGGQTRTASYKDGRLDIALTPVEAVAVLESFERASAPTLTLDDLYVVPPAATVTPVAHRNGNGTNGTTKQPPQEQLPLVLVKAPEPPPEPDTSSQDVPPELATAENFRVVVGHLVDKGFTTQDALVEECKRLKAHVPALSRVANLEERVARALKGLVGEA